MAQRGIQLDRDNFCCSICLDLLKDPVTIPCGHSYCMSCIKGCWDEEEQKNVHSCPQCRQTFTPRPVLVKSTMFAAVVEEVKKTGLQAAPPDHCYAGPGDVACDVCTGRKLKALKSCLVCLASYCERHLQGHYDVAPLKKHQLVNPCKTLQENICSRHNEVMKVFCRTDQQCICYLCSMEEHKDHDTVSAAAERNQRQKELGVSLQNIQQMIQDREKDLKVLQQRVEAINRSADKAVEHSEKIFSEVKQQIRSRQEAEVHQAEELQKKMEQKIAELRRKVTEVQQLSHTEDSVHFLQNSSSLSGLSESTDLPTDVRPPRCFEDVAVAVSEVRDKVEGILKEEGSKISMTVTEDVLLSRPEPKTRDEFLHYSRQITLDPNTAHRRMLLSDGNRKATGVGTDQLYPDHPDRFTGSWQVLSREDLTGRCYFEVEQRGRVSIAVSHKNIYRGIGGESGFGYNDKSWSLYCNNNRYQFIHNQISTPAPGPQSSRVGVYPDHRAGVLSFYSVSGTTMTLLHRVHTSFTQTLCAGFGFYWFDKGSQKKMEQKIAELRRKVTEVQQLSHTEDSFHFLQNSSSLSGLSESTDLPTDVRPPRCFEDVAVAVSEVRDKVEGILKEEGSKISLTVTEDVLLSRPEPKTRDEFLHYSRQITLDPNTAHRRMLLSEGNRKATVVGTDQLYPRHPDRFTGSWQVLSREDLTGRCYFEVEQRGRVSIAVSHKNINRGTGGESGFGYNDKSWSLYCNNNRYQFIHKQISTPAPGPQSSRVGVYPDHRAGVLSFYSVSGTMMTLLHRVHTSFTQTLCAGFGFYWFDKGSVELMKVRDKVEGILKEEGSKISLTVTEDVLLSRPEPKTRDEFLQYSRQITLDPNTAHGRMLLSDGNRKATGVVTDQLYPDHPDRFTGSWQVLSREDLTGRCYFEVEQRGRVSIAVSHKNIYRGIGGESGFGYNDKSWSLYCNNNRYQFIHKQISTPAPGPQSSRVGVYPDHRAGVLSFYSVSGTTMTLLHRVHTSFTQTLCAGSSGMSVDAVDGAVLTL
ncbi:uncharacterized protein ACN63O_022173 [Diretmus argenteus]